MKSEQGRASMIKLFNQSIESFQLSKANSVLCALLLVGAFVTLLTVPVQAAPHRDWQPADTFSFQALTNQ